MFACSRYLRIDKQSTLLPDGLSPLTAAGLRRDIRRSLSNGPDSTDGPRSAEVPAVRLKGFIEWDDYFVALCAARQGDGRWSWVQFEQDLEFRGMASRISLFFIIVPQACSRLKQTRSTRRLNTPANSSKKGSRGLDALIGRKYVRGSAQHARQIRLEPLSP